MKNKVLHHSIVREGAFGSRLTTTLCGRMDNSNNDKGGWNVAGEVSEEVTCKHCLKAKEQAWGKKIIEIARQYKLSHG